MFNLFGRNSEIIDKTSSIISQDVTSNISNNLPDISPTIENMTSAPGAVASSATATIASLPAAASSVASSAASSPNYMFYLIIFIILSLIGINFFGYLAVIIDALESIFGEPFRDFLKFIGYYTSETIKQTVETSAEGTKFVTDISKDVIVNSIDEISTQTSHASNTIKKLDNEIDAELFNKPRIEPNTPTPDKVPYLDRADILMSFDKVKKKEFEDKEATKHYVEDDAGSTIQKGTSASGKSGWCYIGEDRGNRSCMEVGAAHQCMSGDIFPSKEICVNPSLRYS